MDAGPGRSGADPGAVGDLRPGVHAAGFLAELEFSLPDSLQPSVVWLDVFPCPVFSVVVSDSVSTQTPWLGRFLWEDQSVWPLGGP